MRFFILIILTLSNSLMLAQTNVDKVIEKLEILSNASFDNWKYTTDISLTFDELSKLNYDDADWKNLKIDESIYPDSCWMRKVIELPEFLGGEKVSGKVKILVSVDDYGYLFVNGQKRGRFDWSGEMLLTENAKPGEKFIVLIKACNTGGPLRLLQAQLDFDGENTLRQKVADFILSLKTGQKLLSFDTYQSNNRVKVDPGTDKSKIDRKEKEKLNELLNKTVLELDIESIANGNNKNFLKSLEEVQKKLTPVAEFAKKFTLHFTANAHIDAAWLWRKKETIDVCYHTFGSVMNMYAARTDKSKTNFAFAQSQAALYEWMQDLYPDLFNKIKEKVNENLWEIVGGMWVEPDCNLPDGVSWYRQLLYGQKYFEKNLGKRALIGWNPDSFGYNWNMPMFFLNSGIDVFITQKIGWNDTNVFPYRVFWWESPDGSRILAYFPFSYVNDISNPFGLVDWLRQFESNTGFNNLMVLFGVGNHGGGPSIEMMRKIDMLSTLFIFPKIEYGTSEQYINWLKKQDLSEVPVWKDELFLEYHRGTQTTQSDIKAANRKGETLLTNSEKFSSFAYQYGFEYPQAKLKDAWKKVLFNQFHDILPGSSIREVYLDAQKDYNTAFSLGEYTLNNSLKGLAANINTADLTEGNPVIVYNPLSWNRKDVVKIKLPEGDKNSYEIFSADGKKLESQSVEIDELHNELIFIAADVPALGYKVYELRKSENQVFTKKESIVTLTTEQKVPPKVLDVSIENEFFKVTVDTDSGWVKSIFDKKNNKEILSGYGNKLQLLEDKPNAYDAWNIGLTGVEYPTKLRKLEFAEQGTVRTVVRIYRDYLKPGTKKSFPTEDFPNSFFTQDIIIYKGIDRVDFKTSVEWFEEKTMLKVLFPVAVYDSTATYEIPYGTIKRSTTLKAQKDKGKWEVPSIRWADLSDADYGISLLNKGKYGYDIKENNMRLSLLRSPKSPDKTADMGFHDLEYAIYAHKGNFEEAETIKRGYEFNNELIPVIVESSKGTLPKEKSFSKLEPDNLLLTSVKKAEEGGNVFVYQFYETKGKDTLAKLTLPGKPTRVEISNFLEDNGQPIKLNQNIVEIKIRAKSVITLKVVY